AEVDHRIVAAVDQQHRYVDCVEVFDRGDAVQEWVGWTADYQEPVPIAQGPFGAIRFDILQHAFEVRNAGHGYGATVHPGVDCDAGKRGIPAVAATGDADPGRIRHSLPHEVAHAVREVGLHLSPPLTEAGQQVGD